MADRILNWYLDEITGDGTNQGATYCMDVGYALPARVRIYAKRVPEAGDLLIDIKEDGESIFGTYTELSQERTNPLSRVDYHGLATSIYQNNELVDDGTVYARVMNHHNNKGWMDVLLLGTTSMTVGATLSGGTSLATSTIDAFTKGGLHIENAFTEKSYYATLPEGSNKEENAANFAGDKLSVKQFSWITLDVVQSGGAKGITVQLELNSGFNAKQDEEEI